ncbi:hypothetical protein CPT_Merlin230 [Citrobacter phage Merlin]|uniref:Uncharacterized protein n=1 Tax=Citrobacter phage Merlin TaxID=1675602 RepID=A0A0K1LMU4_9CAUD|nr:hypothetical protein CPT_Merlin230 [Citrobacter phage Merlin]AKU43876.1 hypothetical protein CPT_Merlin230 [Citrobacter phage Merlin]
MKLDLSKEYVLDNVSGYLYDNGSNTHINNEVVKFIGDRKFTIKTTGYNRIDGISFDKGETWVSLKDISEQASVYGYIFSAEEIDRGAIKVAPEDKSVREYMVIYTDEDDIPKVAYSGSGNMFTEEEAKTASLELFTEGYKIKNVLVVKKAFEALSKIEVSFV